MEKDVFELHTQFSLYNPALSYSSTSSNRLYNCCAKRLEHILYRSTKSVDL